MALTETTVWTGYSTYWRDSAVDSLYIERRRSPTQLFGLPMAACRAASCNARLVEEPHAMPLRPLPPCSPKKRKGLAAAS
jgi:hypothetical protein